jgi:sugar lactone lactonase YvrE
MVSASPMTATAGEGRHGMDLFASGLSMGESPRWHDDRLWVCDWTAGEVISFGADGGRRVELAVRGFPFSIDWLPDGRAVLTSPTGVVTAAGEPYGAMGQGWNEIVVDRRGNTYVNAAGFDLMGAEEPKPGLLWLIRPDGSSCEVAGDLMFPNGMAVTADGSTLIVAESYARRADRSAGLGRPRRPRAGRDLPRCRGRRLVRVRAGALLRPGGAGG